MNTTLIDFQGIRERFRANMSGKPRLIAIELLLKFKSSDEHEIKEEEILPILKKHESRLTVSEIIAMMNQLLRSKPTLGHICGNGTRGKGSVRSKSHLYKLEPYPSS